MKYSAIVGSLGQVGDRFLRGGYKEDYEIKQGFEQEVKALSELGVLDALDIYYAESGINSDAGEVNEIMRKHHMTISSVFPNVFGEKRWKLGSLASVDEAVRKEAIALCKKAVSFSAGLDGVPPVNLWLGQDGFDYPFEIDYAKSRRCLVESLKEICDYNPEVMITLEAKIREPRNRCIVDTVANALLFCEEAGRKNCGIAVDIGHTLQAGQNIAQNIMLADYFGRLVTMHVDDNYTIWDDDMIVGSVHLTEMLEMCYYLKKIDYQGYLAADLFPYREDTLGCTKETVLNLKKYEELVDLIGMDTIAGLIERGDPTECSKTLRETIFR